MSSTVSVGNSGTSWNDRISPSSARPSGDHVVTSRSSKNTLPLSGRTNPAITSNSVVLPAPFGPISPSVSPAATSSDTSSTASEPAVALGHCLDSQHRARALAGRPAARRRAGGVSRCASSASASAACASDSVRHRPPRDARATRSAGRAAAPTSCTRPPGKYRISSSRPTLLATSASDSTGRTPGRPAPARRRGAGRRGCRSRRRR